MEWKGLFWQFVHYAAGFTKWNGIIYSFVVFLYIVNFQISSFVSSIPHDQHEEEIKNEAEIIESFDVTYASQST